MKEEMVEADVLCIGGGIAGLMAAIRAAELGAKVVVAEKANTLRSGGGATGNDHFRCYIPEFHGPDIQQIVEDIRLAEVGGMRTTNFVRIWMEKSLDIIKLWDSWGIPMKYHGKWDFSGHAVPGGHPPTRIKYAGQNQKLILTREAHKRGAEIINRVMVYDLLCDSSGVVGAVGIDTREDKIITFLVKSVFLATGSCWRLYPGPTPGWVFNLAHPPTNTGDGRAMAYRAGAELVRMEIPKKWAGPKYFSRCGKGTWIGVVRDSQDKPVGPFITKPDKRCGDAVADYYQSLFEDYAKSGKGPVYMDCRGISDEDYEYMMWGLKNEGNIALTNYLEEEGIDLRESAVEFMTYEMTTTGGILSNEKAETSVKGLYAAGDELGLGISHAATFGWIAGESATKHAEEVESPSMNGIKAKTDKCKILFNEIRGREVGASWQETSIALQQVMYDYAGSIRSETLLQAGFSHLRRLREKARSTMIAKNQHELMHCLEVLNLFDIGELIFIASSERKETRDMYVRPDYPFTNPLMDNRVLICKKTGDRPVVGWREVKH